MQSKVNAEPLKYHDSDKHISRLENTVSNPMFPNSNDHRCKNEGFQFQVKSYPSDNGRKLRGKGDSLQNYNCNDYTYCEYDKTQTKLDEKVSFCDVNGDACGLNYL